MPAHSTHRKGCFLIFIVLSFLNSVLFGISKGKCFLADIHLSAQ